MRFVFNDETKETNFISTLEEINAIQKLLSTIDCEDALCSACPLEGLNGCCLYNFEEFVSEQRRKLLRERGE